MSPGAAAAAAVAAVAQGLRQQMCSMVRHLQALSLFYSVLYSCGFQVAAAHNQSSAHDTNPVASLVNTLALAGHCGNVPLPSNGAPPMSMSHMASMRNMSSPAGSIQDLRISPAESAGMESPISSPLGLTVSSTMEPAINMNIGRGLRDFYSDLSTRNLIGLERFAIDLHGIFLLKYPHTQKCAILDLFD